MLLVHALASTSSSLGMCLAPSWPTKVTAVFIVGHATFAAIVKLALVNSDLVIVIDWTSLCHTEATRHSTSPPIELLHRQHTRLKHDEAVFSSYQRGVRRVSIRR